VIGSQAMSKGGNGGNWQSGGNRGEGVAVTGSLAALRGGGGGVWQSGGVEGREWW
jgi:hypothetical protein